MHPRTHRGHGTARGTARRGAGTEHEAWPPAKCQGPARGHTCWRSLCLADAHAADARCRPRLWCSASWAEEAPEGSSNKSHKPMPCKALKVPRLRSNSLKPVNRLGHLHRKRTLWPMQCDQASCMEGGRSCICSRGHHSPIVMTCSAGGLQHTCLHKFTRHLACSQFQ